MMSTWIVCVVVATIAGFVNSDAGYCAISSSHELCQHSQPCASSAGMKVGVNSADKNNILEMHNTLRAKVAKGQESGLPSAANMRKLTYDDELAKIAQAHANKCVFSHDCNDCRKAKNGRFAFVGQNIYMGMSSQKDNSAEWRKATQSWYDEVKDFRSSQVSKFPNGGPVIGHFTQVIWAETSKVGCGFSMYKKDGWFTKLYVCNYGVGGNMLGNPVYKQGATCSQCPAGTSCTNGLCA